MFRQKQRPTLNSSPLNRAQAFNFKRAKSRRFRQTRITIAGCGQVGQTLLQHFKQVHFNATYRPSPLAAERKQNFRELGAKPIKANIQNRIDLKRLATLGGRVIWMAPPRTDTLDTSLKLLQMFCSLRRARYGLSKPRITYVSTTGVYGNVDGRWIDELTARNAQSERAKRRISDENQLFEGSKKGWADVHVLRAPGIYGAERLPLDRLKNRQPAIEAQDDSWSNHIHELDLGRLAFWSQMKSGCREVINACDQTPMKMGDYFDQVADAFGLERPPRLPRDRVREVVSPMMWSFMQESRKIRSIRMHRIGFALRYPSVPSYLEERALIKQTSYPCS
jgi:nucleoside-diphosphate-sugar epimerase